MKKLTAVGYAVAAIMLSGCGSNADVVTATGPGTGRQAAAFAWQPLTGGLTALPPNVDGTADKQALAKYAVRMVVTHDDVSYMLKGPNDLVVKVLGEPDVSITVPLDLTISVHATQTANEELLLVVVGRNGNEGAIRIFRDSDGDEAIESSDLVASIDVPVDGSRPDGSRVTSYVDADGTHLVLDPRNHEVLRLTDTNADGVPDALDATTWLDSTKTAVLGTTRAIEFDADHACAELRADTYVGPQAEDMRTFVRATGGGPADEFTQALHYELTTDINPLIDEPVHSGLTVLRVFGSHNASIQVWESDADGAVIALLGSGTVAGPDNRATVPLPSAPAAGSFLVARDTGAGVDGLVVEVIDSTTEVLVEPSHPRSSTPRLGEPSRSRD